MSKWNSQEVELFYKAISVFGLDFQKITDLLPNKTRNQVKSKYKSESKKNSDKINKYFNMNLSSSHPIAKDLYNRLTLSHERNEQKREEEDSQFNPRKRKRDIEPQQLTKRMLHERQFLSPADYFNNTAAPYTKPASQCKSGTYMNSFGLSDDDLHKFLQNPYPCEDGEFD